MASSEWNFSIRYSLLATRVNEPPAPPQSRWLRRRRCTTPRYPASGFAPPAHAVASRSGGRRVRRLAGRGLQRSRSLVVLLRVGPDRRSMPTPTPLTLCLSRRLLHLR